MGLYLLPYTRLVTDTQWPSIRRNSWTLAQGDLKDVLLLFRRFHVKNQLQLHEVLIIGENRLTTLAKNLKLNGIIWSLVLNN